MRTSYSPFEEAIKYSHYIGVTTGFSELNSSVKQRKIVQTESRMDLFIMPRCSRFKPCDKSQSDARQVKFTYSMPFLLLMPQLYLQTLPSVPSLWQDFILPCLLSLGIEKISSLHSLTRSLD